MRILEMAPDNRPRERLKKNGPSNLSEAELLALILQKGTHQENVIDLSNRILSNSNLTQISNLTISELEKIKGIGPAKACQIVAMFELSKRLKQSANNGKTIRCAKDVFEFSSPQLCTKDKEHFLLLILDTKNKVAKEEVISIGTLNSSLIHPREIFKSAIKESANSVILVHNHPSGDPAPSKEDRDVTKKLFEAGEILGIKVLDHVIIGREGYYSFAEK